jgi:hypothetical protein
MIVATVLLATAPATVRAQDAEITQAVLDYFFKARTAEAAEEDKVEDQLKDVDARSSTSAARHTMRPAEPAGWRRWPPRRS